MRRSSGQLNKLIKHSHQKRHNGRKILLAVLLLILLSILATIYLYIPVNNAAPNVTEPFLSITPDSIQQGEPALITVEGLTSTSSIKSFTINDIPLVMFLHTDQVTALLGVDLRATPGTYSLVLTFKDGEQIRGNLIINERSLVKVPFVIPEKLGGNTRASERELISTLATEAKIINALPTGSEKLWTLPFGSPLKGALVVSDAYGYTRIIGKSTMSHKGVDLNAPMGTSVYAMNRGMVIFTNYLRNYGNVVIIDHGIGLQTVYIHLSKINVTENQMVEKGELIGLSGDTGYVLGPHLHLSVKIWDISIDPIKFLELLGSKN